MTSTVYGSQATQTPAATQIAADLERRIITGTLQPGTKLPPERAFAKRYQVSRSTLRDALLELENKNLIRRVQGNGTIVLEPPRDEWDLRAMTAKSNPEYVAELRYTIEPYHRQARRSARHCGRPAADQRGRGQNRDGIESGRRHGY
jgi:GntR family transcriptional repressor for pyruvate dehydrogenase complex